MKSQNTAKKEGKELCSILPVFILLYVRFNTAVIYVVCTVPFCYCIYLFICCLYVSIFVEL